MNRGSSVSGKTYLGDSVYASFDGYMICLQANGETETIYLEPQVLEALLDYAGKIYNRRIIVEQMPGEKSSSQVFGGSS